MYYIISFLAGMSVMILEIAGIEVTNSYIDNTNIICTGIIGIMMIALTIGYLLGGRLSKYRPTPVKLSSFIVISAVYILILALFNFTFLSYIYSSGLSIIIKILISSVILFALPSILLGAVTPYIIQVVISERKRYKIAGSVSGKLYAVSNVGSILGTFLCGFYLNINFSTKTTFLFLCFILIVCAILCNFSVIKERFLTKNAE